MCHARTINLFPRMITFKLLLAIMAASTFFAAFGQFRNRNFNIAEVFYYFLLKSDLRSLIINLFVFSFFIK